MIQSFTYGIIGGTWISITMAMYQGQDELHPEYKIPLWFLGLWPIIVPIYFIVSAVKFVYNNLVR